MAKSEPLNDEELAFSMLCFMEDYGGERIVKALANACRLVAADAEKNLDGTSRDIYNKAAKDIDNAADFLATN